MILIAARSTVGFSFFFFFQFKKTRIHRTSHINEIKWVQMIDTLVSTQLAPHDYDFSKMVVEKRQNK